MCGRASLVPRHDVIVFENLRFRPSKRIQHISIFKNLHPGECIWKPLFLVPENAGYVGMVIEFGENISVFENTRQRVDGVSISKSRLSNLVNVVCISCTSHTHAAFQFNLIIIIIIIFEAYVAHFYTTLNAHYNIYRNIKYGCYKM